MTFEERICKRDGEWGQFGWEKYLKKIRRVHIDIYTTIYANRELLSKLLAPRLSSEAVRHEREISDAGR
jgi:hypothetical protein